MLIHRAVTIALFLLLSTNAEAPAQDAKSQAVRTAGAGSIERCDRWLKARKSRNFSDLGNWALGFISGVAIYTESLNPLERIEPDAVLAWLDQYCQRRPRATFIEAIRAFIQKHPG
jgi:hypothetical protein